MPADVRVDRTRTQHRRRHVASPTAELALKGCHKRNHTVFGHVVRAHHASGSKTRHRRSGVDVPFALLFDERQEDLNPIDRTPKIDVDDPLPIGELDLLGRRKWSICFCVICDVLLAKAQRCAFGKS